MTAFSSYVFPATGAPTNRSLPNRLVDFVNVKDFGAKGDNVANDQPAITAAIDYVENTFFGPASTGAIIYFPPGIYLIGSPPLILDRMGTGFPASQGSFLTYMGAGREATKLTGSNANGNPTETPDNNSFLVMFGRYVGSVQCIRDMTIENTATAIRSGALSCGSSGNELHLVNLRLRGTIGFSHSQGTFGMTIQDCIAENTRAITDASADITTRSPYFTYDKFKARLFGTISGIVKSGGNAVVTTSGPHNLPAGSSILVLSASPFAWTPDGSGIQVVAVSNTGASTFTYPLAATPSPFSSGNFGESQLIGSCGFYTSQCQLINCHATGYDIGFCDSGFGAIMVGCSAKQCGAGFFGSIVDGTESGDQHADGSPAPAPALGPVACSAMNVVSNYFERCTWAIAYFQGGVSLVAANYIVGTTGPTNPAVISSIVKSGANAVVTTSVNHNLPIGLTNLVIVASPAAWTPDASGDQILTVTNTATNQFTYPLAASPSPFSSGTWNYPNEYAITHSSISQAVYAANVLDVRCSKASFDWAQPEYPPGQSGVAYDVMVLATLGPYGWNPSAVNGVNSGLNFRQCGTTNSGFLNANAVGAPLAICKFSDLPINNSGQQAGPLENQEYNITDGQKSGGGAATFGDIVVGGSSNHYKVRRNNANWIRVG